MAGGVAGVVLAAGGGTRLGGRPKALLTVGGELFVERAVRTLREGGCAEVVVVLGHEAAEVRGAMRQGGRYAVEGAGSSIGHEAAEIRGAVRPGGRRPAEGSGSSIGHEAADIRRVENRRVDNRRAEDLRDCHLVDNPAWGTGLASSFRAGLAAVPAGCTAAAILLVDQPFVTAEAVRAVLAAHARGAEIAAAAYAGRRGHPVLLAARHWPAAAASAHGDRGARAFLDAHAAEAVTVPCDGLGDPRDVDTPEDLRTLSDVRTL